MDHREDPEQPRGSLIELIEILVEAESILLSAQTVMRESSLADRPGYESIEGHVGTALGSMRAAVAEAHHKLHEA
jgi:hypothetical protein